MIGLPHHQPGPRSGATPRLSKTAAIAVSCVMLSAGLGCRRGGKGDTAGATWAVTDLAERPRFVAERGRRAAHNVAASIPASEAAELAADLRAGIGEPLDAGVARGETALLGPAPVPGADPITPAVRARALLDDGRAEDALVVLRRALVEAPPEDFTLRILEGRCLLALGRHGDARSAFNEALRVVPAGSEARGEALYGRAKAALALNDVAGAEADLKALQAASTDGQNDEALQLLAVEVARTKGAGADTLSALRAAAVHDARAAASLGAVLARQGDHAGAIVALRKALEDQPDDPTLLLELGTSLAATAALPEAEAALTRSTATQPKLPQGWRNLAAVRERQGNKRGAVVAWQSLIDNVPEADAEGTVRARIETLRAELQSAPTTP